MLIMMEQPPVERKGKTRRAVGGKNRSVSKRGEAGKSSRKTGMDDLG
jgi:hypothetical protein